MLGAGQGWPFMTESIRSAAWWCLPSTGSTAAGSGH